MLARCLAVILMASGLAMLAAGVVYGARMDAALAAEGVGQPGGLGAAVRSLGVGLVVAGLGTFAIHRLVARARA